MWKCTLCYDRLKDDMQPACAQACPTKSIQFGDLDELRERASGPARDAPRGEAPTSARLYGDDPDDGVGGCGAFFLLLDEPRGVRTAARTRSSTTRDLGSMWRSAGLAAGALGAMAVAAVLGARR